MTGALSDELAPGIHRIAVPTPFAVGRVNCYLLTGEPLTLVDVGPNSGTSLDCLERGLAELKVRVEDLELIVLTHQHMDHEGLLEIVARRSGAEIAAYAGLVPWLADYQTSTKGDDAWAEQLMGNHGVPAELVSVIAVLAAGMHAYGSRGVVTRPLEGGDTLTMGGRDYTVHHRPGHSPSDLVFSAAADGVLITGDHLIEHISSNAIVTRPLGGELTDARPPALIQYARSMRETRELPGGLVLPGHGEVIADHVALVDRRLDEHDRRARKILSLISEGPLTGHEIARKMWGEIAVKQAYMTLSEVLGHLDLLLTAGTASESDADGVSRFAAA